MLNPTIDIVNITCLLNINNVFNELFSVRTRNYIENYLLFRCLLINDSLSVCPFMFSSRSIVSRRLLSSCGWISAGASILNSFSGKSPSISSITEITSSMENSRDRKKTAKLKKRTKLAQIWGCLLLRLNIVREHSLLILSQNENVWCHPQHRPIAGPVSGCRGRGAGCTATAVPHTCLPCAPA